MIYIALNYFVIIVKSRSVLCPDLWCSTALSVSICALYDILAFYSVFYCCDGHTIFVCGKFVRILI